MKIRAWMTGSLLLVSFQISTIRAEIVDRIAAVINNDVITLSELDEVVNSVQGSALSSIADPAARRQKQAELRKELLEQMIDQRLLTQEYDKLQIVATDQDVETMIDAVCKQNNIDRDTLRHELDKQSISYTDYRDQMKQHVLQGKFIEQQIRPKISISEADVKNLYNRKLGELSDGESAELTGVLVEVARGGGPGSVEAAQKQAKAAREQLLRGLSADEIAHQSADGAVKSMGEMGTFKKGELMEALDKAVFELHEGQVTQPIESPQGLYVIKLKSLGKVAGSKPYEEVREQLYRRLYDQQIETQLQIFVKNARKEAHVEILL